MWISMMWKSVNLNAGQPSLDDMICDMIFIYCSWVTTRSQWSVDSYKNRKETATGCGRKNTPI